MKHQKIPSANDVLNSVKDLPTTGTLAQDSENGMLLYLNISDDWIFNALEVLHSYGFIRPPFFVYPPYPVGAHVKIVTKREAEDHELFGRDLSHLIGKSVEFEVVKAHVSYPRIKRYGIEARYKIRISSPELSAIREELTGLSSGPNNGHFVILVGLRMDEEEFEQKFSPEQKHEELDDTTPLASTKKSKVASISSDDDDEEETKARMKLAPAPKSKSKSTSKKSSSKTKKSVEIKPASNSETSSSDDEEVTKASEAMMKPSTSTKSKPRSDTKKSSSARTKKPVVTSTSESSSEEETNISSETGMKLAPASKSKSMTKKSKPVSSSSPSETSSSDDEEEIKPSQASKSSKSLPKKSPESALNLQNLTLLTIIVINIATFGVLSFYGYKSMSK